MTWRISGAACTRCDLAPPRPALRDGLCVSCLRLLGALGTARPVDAPSVVREFTATLDANAYLSLLHGTPPEMARTLDEIRALDETGER